jgi:hypothetical protein
MNPCVEASLVADATARVDTQPAGRLVLHMTSYCVTKSISSWQGQYTPRGEVTEMHRRGYAQKGPKMEVELCQGPGRKANIPAIHWPCLRILVVRARQECPPFGPITQHFEGKREALYGFWLQDRERGHTLE